MRDAYIVTSIRTPGCRRSKGAFKDTRPEDLLSFILSTAVEKTENLEKKDVEDIMVGCSFPEAEQGLNIGRIASQMAGFPVETTGATVNRFCSSGLEAIALAALRVMAGCRYRQRSGIHDLRSHGRQSSAAPSGVYAPGCPGVYIHGHHRRKCGQPLRHRPPSTG